MKKIYLFCLAAFTLGLTACDNYFDEKYLNNGDPQVCVVKTYDYTLAASDYATIANNKTNKTYAQSLDTIDGGTANQDALAQVGANGYFNETASADMYVPAFIYSKYPHLDPGSIFNVTYRTYDGLPAYLKIFNQTIQYTLTAKDYKDLWGDDVTQYLTPAQESRIGDYLPQVDDDYFVGVVYNFSADGGATIEQREDLWQYKDGYIWQAYRHADFPLLILPPTANGQVDKYLLNTYPYAQKDDRVVVMQYDSKTKLYAATEYNHDGEQFVAYDGVVQEDMSFVLSTGWAANLSTYFAQAVAGEGSMGKLTIQDFDLEDGITYIWAFDNSYGMKGTAYKSGPHYGEGWFVTPAIKLKNSTAPALSFDMALNYGPTPEDGRYEQATVWVSTDYAGDVRTATWTQLPWNEFDGIIGFPDANSWTFYNSGRMDLSAWNNQKIYIGFRYKSLPGQTCSTWEVKNILVNEPVANEELD